MLRKKLAEYDLVDITKASIFVAVISIFVLSLFNSLVYPLLGILVGGIDFSALKVTIGNSTIHYGELINTTIDCLVYILAGFVLVVLMKLIGSRCPKHEQG